MRRMSAQPTSTGTPIPEPSTPRHEPQDALILRGRHIEELVLRHIEHVRGLGADARLCAMAKTQIELGWMCLNRAMLPPERISGDLDL
jgi:hypothetical protein